MPLFTGYLARCQHLLQQGQPVAGVLWNLGDDLDHRPRQDTPFPDGYDFDYLNHDVLLNRLEVKVTNTWHNRLSYDETLPKDRRKTWTLSGPQKNSPIKPAGLTGPAVIRIAEVAKITP